MTLRMLFPQAMQRTAIACLTLAALSPLSFYVSFLMPDVLAGLTILACANLLVFSNRLSRAALLFWFAVLSFAVASHTSHMTIGAALFLIGAAWILLGRPTTRKLGLLVIGAALVVGLAAEIVFSSAVTAVVGKPPIRPPFVSARIIRDGPGYRYIKDTCPQNGYVVCRFTDRLPLPVNTFLWSSEPDQGVFPVSDPETRRGLSNEQIRFFLSVYAYDPIGQTFASLKNSWRQLWTIGLSGFNYSREQIEGFSIKLPPSYFAVLKQTRAYDGSISTTAIVLL